MDPSKAARFETTSLESLSAAAGAEIVPTEFFFEEFVAVDNPLPPLDLGFGGVSATPFTHGLEKMFPGRIVRRSCVAWGTSLSNLLVFQSDILLDT